MDISGRYNTTRKANTIKEYIFNSAECKLNSAGATIKDAEWKYSLRCEAADTSQFIIHGKSADATVSLLRLEFEVSVVDVGGVAVVQENIY